jgi:uroporphyrinogen decarboxylase
MRLVYPDQFLPEIEAPVRLFARADAQPIMFPVKQWRSCDILGDEDCLVPADFVPVRGKDGKWILSDATGNPTAVFSEGGSSFRSLTAPLADVASVGDLAGHRSDIEAIDAPAYLSEDYAALARSARALRAESDNALVLYLGGHILAGGQWLMGYEKFMMEIALNPSLVEALLDAIVEVQLARFAKYADAVRGCVDVVYISDDLGTQAAPQLSPDLYRRIVKPRHARICAAARRQFEAVLMLHTDGAVSEFIPDFIEMGIQALNPIQVSAAGMDTSRLKREFGEDIAFWGGACNSQHTLPFGSARDVEEEVRRRISDLAPGGGFVFSHIHNMQPETPARNIVVMYEAAHRFG